MGKSLPSATKLQELTKIFSSSHKPKPNKKPPAPIVSLRPPGEARVDSDRTNFKRMESSSFVLDGQNRVPLARVVSDCAKRWFQDTLKEAKAGDVAMQVLVGQMYHSGYGVPRDALKGRAWINKASKIRASVWKISEKRPGCNASDSDSEEANVVVSPRPAHIGRLIMNEEDVSSPERFIGP